MSYAIDDAEYIRRRLEEIEAEKKLALTGSTLEQPKDEVPSIETVYGWGMYGQADVSPSGFGNLGGTATFTLGPSWVEQPKAEFEKREKEYFQKLEDRYQRHIKQYKDTLEASVKSGEVALIGEDGRYTSSIDDLSYSGFGRLGCGFGRLGGGASVQVSAEDFDYD